MVSRSLLFLVLCGMIFSCSNDEGSEGKVPKIFTPNLDTTVRAQDNLFQFANGKWLARTVIPPDQGAWGSFHELIDNNEKIIRNVLTRTSRDPEMPEGSDLLKAAQFFDIGNDSLLAEKWGGKVLDPIMEQIGEINNIALLQHYLADQELQGGGAFFRIAIRPDYRNSEKMALYLESGGLGLPERDYYVKTDPKAIETREKYEAHIARMLSLAGYPTGEAVASAEAIMTLETRLARATATKEERRDPARMYHKKGMGEMGALVPALDWKKYFEALGIHEDSLIVREPEFMAEVNRIITAGRWKTIRDYLEWMAIDKAAPYLSHAFVQADFEFNSRYLRDINELKPRWKRALHATERYMGEAIGQLYVAEAFPPEAKKTASDMVENMKLAFAERIKTLDWMSDSTKIMALAKLKAMHVKIGYPDEWKSYAGLKVESNSDLTSFYDNVVSACRFTVQRQVEKLGKSPDRMEWNMNPQTVNAYYNAQFNEIVLPAGILQPPFFNYEADAAVNYGGIGAVMGHEMSHAFDDRGSQFDADGNLKNWWSEKDLAQFRMKTKALAAQYDAYEPLPGVHVQGQFTLGENMGDLGGLNVAYDGLQRHLREHGRQALMEGFTPEQRFFLSWATIWRVKVREESLRTMINTNPHAPNQYRANGPVSNMATFYEAFHLTPGDGLYRDEKDRIKIW